MSTPSDVTSFTQMMKDMFPLPGQPVKDWVMAARAQRAEVERIGPRVRVEPHLDNTGAPCREVGPASLVHDLFFHDCCNVCGDRGEALGKIGRMFEPLAKGPT